MLISTIFQVKMSRVVSSLYRMSRSQIGPTLFIKQMTNMVDMVFSVFFLKMGIFTANSYHNGCHFQQFECILT